MLTRAQRREKRRIYKIASESVINLERVLKDMRIFLSENSADLTNLNSAEELQVVARAFARTRALEGLLLSIHHFNNLRED